MGDNPPILLEPLETSLDMGIKGIGNSPIKPGVNITHYYPKGSLDSGFLVTFDENSPEMRKPKRILPHNYSSIIYD